MIKETKKAGGQNLCFQAKCTLKNTKSRRFLSDEIGIGCFCSKYAVFMWCFWLILKLDIVKTD